MIHRHELEAAAELQLDDGSDNHLGAGVTEKDTTGASVAWENADDFWRSVAMTAMKWLIELRQPFDAYDLTELGVPDPDHPNRWGALFQAAHKQGVIQVEGYRQSRRPGRAGGLCRVWRGVG